MASSLFKIEYGDIVMKSSYTQSDLEFTDLFMTKAHTHTFVDDFRYNPKTDSEIGETSNLRIKKREESNNMSIQFVCCTLGQEGGTNKLQKR